jgi:hypothetical protein
MPCNFHYQPIAENPLPPQIRKPVSSRECRKIFSLECDGLLPLVLHNWSSVDIKEPHTSAEALLRCKEQVFLNLNISVHYQHYNIK